MKLIRFRENGKIKPGIILSNRYYDVSSFCKEYDEHFFESDGLNQLQKFVEENRNRLTGVMDVELESPFTRPSKIICIGLNYADHAKETGAAIPEEPIIFFKATSAITGPFDDVVIPKNSTKSDWEVELAVVIGKKVSYVDEAQAMDYVAGYCLHNDLSERAFQLEGEGNG